MYSYRDHNDPFNKQVQETQKQYAYLSVKLLIDHYKNYIYDGKMVDYCQKSKAIKQTKSLILVLALFGLSLGQCTYFSLHQ